MKKILPLTLILILFAAPGDTKTVRTVEEKINAYYDLFSRVEKQHKKLDKFAYRHIYHKDRNFGPETWKYWSQQWDEMNLFIKTEARKFSGWDPIIYEHFALALRSLTVMGYEYRKYFFGELVTLDDVEAHKRDFEANMDALLFEINFLKQKYEISIPYSN